MKLTVTWKALGLLTLPLALGVACSLGGNRSVAPPPAAPAGPAVEATAEAPPPEATKGERGTPDEAKAMLQLAIEHYQSAGRDQALADFNAGASPFIDRDLYVVCLGHDAVETANGGFPQYVGVSANSILDADGNPLGKALLDAAAGQDIGSVAYRWINPVSGETEDKVTFVKDLGQDVCGVGAYNPTP